MYITLQQIALLCILFVTQIEVPFNVLMIRIDLSFGAFETRILIVIIRTVYVQASQNKILSK